MRDPIENVKTALRGAGAVYKGGGSAKGSSWVFPDGEEFLFERKSGSPTIDARVATRKLNQVLARRNGQVPEAAVQRVNGAVHAEVPVAPVVVVPAYEPMQALDTPPSPNMKDRWVAALAQAEAYQEKLLADAQVAERRVLMLKAMVPFMEDHAFADTLRAVLRSLEPAPAPAVVTPRQPPPPQQISECVQVTRQLVYAATQTFDGTFTVNDVVACMLNGREVSKVERARIRMSVAGSMIALGERGELVREHQGVGRQQTVWRRVVHAAREAQSPAHAQPAN
ncbi:MAG: hypothetical protein LAQ69_14440 [Acidobacteriia bacterium]|nr:hypothetical protein [Terriglobia bacterium]